MPQYRVFLLDEGRQLVGGPHVIDCDEDATAIECAKQLRAGRALEIWDRDRLIAIITRDGKVM